MSKRPDMNINHSVIFDYWKDKYIDVEGKIVFKFRHGVLPVINDWGEPSCWCCGKFCKGIYENIAYDVDINNNVNKIWDYKAVKSMLNRCHIVAHSLGGSDNADNLFLMCESCHIQAPDCNDSSMFFKWIYYKRNKKMCLYNDFELDNIIKELEDIRKTYNKSSINLSYDDNVLLLQNKIKISSHGGKIAPASLIMNLLDVD